MLFLRLSTNVASDLRLIQGLNTCAESAGLELQMRCHDEQLHLICKLFKTQLVAVRKATHEAVRDEVWAQFVQVCLGPKAQDAATEKEKSELPRAAVEDMDLVGTPS